MLKKQYFIIMLMLILIGCSNSENSAIEEIDQNTQPQNPTEGDVPIKIVAHRGAWKEFELPDNSLAALKKAIEIGSDASECDIQLTKDLQVIVFHDEKIAGNYFKDLTYEQLSNYSLSNGEKIPLLADFLEVVTIENFELWIDIKSLSDSAGGNAWSIKAGEEAAKIIRNKKAQNNVSYIVGRKAVLDKCIIAIKGEWEMAYMNTDYTPEQFVNQGLTWANFSYSKLYEKPALLKAYQNENIKVSVYTVDEPSIMNWFLAQNGLYAITSNYPQMLLNKL